MGQGRTRTYSEAKAHQATGFGFGSIRDEMGWDQILVRRASAAADGIRSTVLSRTTEYGERGIIRPRNSFELFPTGDIFTTITTRGNSFLFLSESKASQRLRQQCPSIQIRNEEQRYPPSCTEVACDALHDGLSINLHQRTQAANGSFRRRSASRLLIRASIPREKVSTTFPVALSPEALLYFQHAISKSDEAGDSV